MILFDKYLNEYSNFVTENDEIFLGTASKQHELAISINEVFAKIYHEEVKELPGRPVNVNYVE